MSWLWCALVVGVVVVVSGNECDNHANGCSIPLNLYLPYKVTFTPSCNRHDICYGCGTKFGFSKADCDNGFLNDMKAACAARGRRDLQKRGACEIAAQDVYYWAVHHFGSSHFHTTPVSYCSGTWVRSCLP